MPTRKIVSSLQLYHRLRLRTCVWLQSNSTMAMPGGIHAIRGNQDGLDIDELARFAIAEHNKKQNTLLQFGKVVNAKMQMVSGLMYHITLEAADGGSKKVYDAKVWVKPWMNFKSLHEFKLAGDASQ